MQRILILGRKFPGMVSACSSDALHKLQTHSAHLCNVCCVSPVLTLRKSKDELLVNSY